MSILPGTAPFPIGYRITEVNEEKTVRSSRRVYPFPNRRIVYKLMGKNIILSSLTRTRTRMWVSVTLLFVAMSVILVFSATNHFNSLIELRKREIRRQVEIAMNTIQPYITKVNRGEMSREEALDNILPILRRMTYSSETMENYLFMSSYDGTMLVQPLEPWLQGTNQLKAVDAQGNYYIKDLIETAQSPEGEGFVSYYYPPPGSDNPGRKISFVKGIPELQCYLGTGMFYNDIVQLFREYLIGPLFFMVITFLSLLILTVFYLHPLFKSFQILVNSFHEISRNPESRPEIPFEIFNEDSDEYEILSGFDSMLDSIKTSRELLIQADKMASIGVLTAGVAHEINNPNQVILSRASLLNGLIAGLIPILDEYYQENGDFSINGSPYSEIRTSLLSHVEGITGSSRRISKLIEDLKSLSRDSSGMDLANVDINTIVKTSIDLCRSLPKISTESLTVDLSDELPAIRGNTQRLEQVCINILENAAQAITKENGRISVQTRLDSDKQQIVLTVEDNGSGIPQKNLKSIFDPFFTTKRESGGTGLGLSISRTIIHNHDGDIVFESTEGEGTMVQVHLPISEVSGKGQEV